MATFCIPKHLVNKLKESAIKGEVDIAKLYEMSSAERRDFFAKHTDVELGKFINTKFEGAMISKQKNAILDWAKSIFDPKMKNKEAAKSVLDKINELDELGVLSPESERSFLQDLVAEKLGVTVTSEQVGIIKEKALRISDAQKVLGDDLGSPLKLQENLEFFKSKKDMDDYLAGAAPASELKVAVGTYGRGMMLASAKSPILNIGSNIEVGTTEAISRRLASGQWRGADNKLALEYMKMVNKIYQETGYDVSRMTSITDTGVSGERVLGESVHAQGPGMVRKAGRVVEDIVFKQLMGALDVAFSSAHFADSVNLNSMKMAKGDKAKASEMMRDAMRITPQTLEGELLRSQGILDAQTATWTNETWASTTSEGIRKLINKVSGVRAGDVIMPFVKTPANVVATGMDYAGLGAIKGAVKAAKAIKSGDIKDQNVMQSITRDFVRSGIGLTGAFIITSMLDDDDFVGSYDPQRRQIEQLRNSNTNSFRLGNKWVSTAWLGPLAVPVTAIMYARKYGKGLAGKSFQFAKGVGSQVLDVPGISDISDYFKSQSRKDLSLEEATEETKNYVLSEATSRLTPSFMSDVAKAHDPYEREGYKGLAGIKNKIPFIREESPTKKNVFGEDIESEPWWSVLAFGSRVKTDREDPIISELSRVQESSDKTMNFTDFSKSSSKQLSQFRAKVGDDRYEKARVEYGQTLKNKIKNLISSYSYKNMSDEDKAKEINGLDAEAIQETFRKYGFRYKRDRKPPFAR